MLRLPGKRNLATGTSHPDKVPRHSYLGVRPNCEILTFRDAGVTTSDLQQGFGELMLTALILVISATGVLILVLLAVVVVAIRQEPRDAEMSHMAPSLIAVMVRRLLGVYLRRPTPPAGSTDWREEYSPDAWPTTGWTKPTILPPDGRR